MYAASSLSEVFGLLAERFEQERGARVAFSFASSSALARQIAAGAPADLFATADPQLLDQVEFRVQAPGTPFASAPLSIVVPRGNPKAIAALRDLARADVDVLLCVREAPCGALADAALADAGVTAHVVARAANARAVRTTVALGEADAGIVYAPDVRRQEAVQGVALPASGHMARYVVAVLGTGARANAAQWATERARRSLARAFVELVVSPFGRRTLSEAGFEVP